MMEQQLKALGLTSQDLIYFRTATKRRNGWEKQSWYKVKGGDDAVLIRQFLDGRKEVSLHVNHFSKLKDYGELCKRKAERLRLPIEILLAIGPENDKLIPLEFQADDVLKVRHELLDTGIERRKRQIKSILGDDLYCKFKVENMGQLNSKRLASYLSTILK
jgi:hypothetical protein